MGKDKRKNRKPSLEELQAELEEAVGLLSQAFLDGMDGDVSSLTARVRAIEKEIAESYYSRWGIP